MLKHNEVNPLTVFGLRSVDHCPPHFTRVEFDLKTSEKAISDWIWANLSGRFYYGDWYSNSDIVNGGVSFNKCVAFEIPAEASYFALMITQINKFES